MSSSQPRAQRTWPRVSRRQVLAATVASAGLATAGQGARTLREVAAQDLPATPMASPGAATPVPFVSGLPLQEPRELRSENGRLDVEFAAQYGPATMGGSPVTTFAYNGESPGPTLRLRPGETLGVTVSNRLDQPTNLHTHGLHISPSGNSDNVLLHIMPGETFQFEFTIPSDGISGLDIPGFYWYHPHIHGFTAPQTGGGMAGALIVEGGLDELPEIKDLPERLLILQDMQFEDGALVPAPFIELAQIFVNGQLQPTIQIAPGETQRWRIVNTSIFTFMNLALEGHQLHQIASDANPLNAVWSQDAILLSPGERIDVLIQGGAEGAYAFRSLAWGEDLEFQAQPEKPIATLISVGPAIEPTPLPDALIPFEDLRGLPVDRVREVVFSEVLSPFAPQIDGRSFDPNRVDQRVQLGALEEWRLSNTSPDWHPFHIHVNDFQLISINGEPYEARSWEDTTPIPAGGEIVIRSRFLDFTGKYVYHCHILDHEDMGMMGIVKVVDEGAATPTA